MKMRIYWLAVYDDRDDSTDMRPVAGPFPSWSAAFDAQQDEGVIVSQVIEVEFD